MTEKVTVENAKTIDELEQAVNDIKPVDTTQSVGQAKPVTSEQPAEPVGTDKPITSESVDPAQLGDFAQPGESAQIEDKTEKVKVEKTLITDDQRKKLNIPAKFKYMEDVIKWGTEAEKAKNQFDTERQAALSETEKYKAEIAKLKAELATQVETGTISKDEQKKKIDELNDLFFDNPIEAVKQVIKETIEAKKENKQIETADSKDEKLEKLKADFTARAQQDWQEIINGMDEQEAQDLAKELQKIANENPTIVSLKVIHDIYRIRKIDEENLLKKEEERKKRAKQTAVNILSDKAPVQSVEKLTKVNSAKSLKELEELEKNIGM